jgi:hypothetical protein
MSFKNKNLEKLKDEFFNLKTEINDLFGLEDRSGYSYLQNYIYYAHYPIFSFTESVIILIDKGKSHVANVLLRTLFEAHIDVIYHQLGDSKERLALSARRIFDERIIALREIEKLIKDNPNLISADVTSLFNKTHLEGAIKDQEAHRTEILNGNPNLQKIKKVHLSEKARLCDEGQVKGAEKGHFGRMYSLIYRQLSPVAHLNVEGLQNFVEQDQSGKQFFSDGDEGDFIIGQAVEICLAFTKDLFDTGVLGGDYIDRIKEIEGLLK